MADEPQSIDERDYDALNTTRLLQRWQHEQDARARDALIRKHLPWVQREASRHLGPAMRPRIESGDIVSLSLMRLLKDGPRFQIDNEQKFLGLLRIMVLNEIRDQSDFFRAQRRSMFQERDMTESVVLDLDRAASARPEEQLQQAEEWATLRLALELLAPDDREVILMRVRKELPYKEIAATLGIAEGAAQQRYVRAAERLVRAKAHIAARDLDRLLEEFGPDADPLADA